MKKQSDPNKRTARIFGNIASAFAALVFLALILAAFGLGMDSKAGQIILAIIIVAGIVMMLAVSWQLLIKPTMNAMDGDDRQKKFISFALFGAMSNSSWKERAARHIEGKHTTPEVSWFILGDRDKQNGERKNDPRLR